MFILFTQDDDEIQIYVPENQRASGGDATELEVTAEPNRSEDQIPNEKTTEDVATNEKESISLDAQVEAESRSGEMSEVKDTAPSEVVSPPSPEDVDAMSQPSSNGVDFCLAPEPEFHEFEEASDKGESSVVACSLVDADLLTLSDVRTDISVHGLCDRNMGILPASKRHFTVSPHELFTCFRSAGIH